jgi:hypothetical protein
VLNLRRKLEMLSSTRGLQDLRTMPALETAYPHHLMQLGHIVPREIRPTRAQVVASEDTCSRYSAPWRVSESCRELQFCLMFAHLHSRATF